MSIISRKTAVKATIATVASVIVSVSIVLLLVPMLGGHPDGPGFWMSVLCPLVIAGPASTWQFHQQEQIARARDELASTHMALDRAHRELAALHAALSERARTDALTGGLNREALLGVLAQNSRSDQGTCALLLVDADHFKRVNDRFGHLVGDEALRLIGRAMEACLGNSGNWGRIGGEEFAVVLPGADSASALAIAERLRVAVQEAGLTHHGLVVPLSVSIGVALRRCPFDPTDLFRVADANLYRAKNDGRNRIAVEGAPDLRYRSE